jgi:hypothetical protein
MVVTLLATAANPEANAWAPVPARLDAIATVRGRAMLVLLVGLQSSFASAMPRNCPTGESKNAITIDAKVIL